MTMTPEEFTAVCKRLFGRKSDGYGWKAEMNRRFGTPLRTIQSWASNENPIPGIVAGLLLMLDQRGYSLRRKGRSPMERERIHSRN